MVAKPVAARWEWPLRRFAWLEVAWGGFALANLGAVWLVPAWERVPFHFIWVSPTLVNGFRVWNLASSRARSQAAPGNTHAAQAWVRGHLPMVLSARPAAAA